MTYELAQQLKDAGFPQKTQWSFVKMHEDKHQAFKLMVVGKDGRENLIANYYDVVSAPTLSELIKACGTHFYDLTYRLGVESQMWWEASSRTIPRLFQADSPEEAVANLWLALNRK